MHKTSHILKIYAYYYFFNEIKSILFALLEFICTFALQTGVSGCISRIILMDTPIFFSSLNSKILINLTKFEEGLSVKTLLPRLFFVYTIMIAVGNGDVWVLMGVDAVNVTSILFSFSSISLMSFIISLS